MPTFSPEVLLPYPSSLDILRILRMKMARGLLCELVAFHQRAASGQFRSWAHGCGESGS
jgi:hypothetical protein